MLLEEVDQLRFQLKKAQSSLTKLQNKCMAGQAIPSDFVQFGQSSYKLVTNPKLAYKPAEDYCRTLHPRAHLVTIESKEENQFLRDLMVNDHGTYFALIGGNDLAKEGDWRWISTGKPMQYTNWTPGMPDNSGNYEHCVTMLDSGKWNDLGCDYVEDGFFCEIDPDLSTESILG
ncbi:perlucin-like [Lingula anatina]|uniref:Perlucin-like n=1 Tax=Lingula anatina TaxID=7574 RepID=A0A1S3H357_LINAN|nr:perlucin-like [Lingula anatina]|eukprot:XP_013380382.1 perlucin-like [Lingula anatina]